MVKPGKGPSPSPAGSTALALIRALRPRQWIKNVLVFLPFLFAVDLAWSPGDLTTLREPLVRLLLMGVSFCALSASVYLLNDLQDREADRNHPSKRFRPLASGQVGTSLAVGALTVLATAGLAISTFIDPLMGGIGALYLALNLGYSLGLKRVVIVDVLLVASGYVIRTVAGALVIGVVPSPWLYTTTGAAALFIVLGKRFAEVRLAADSTGNQRPVLLQYPAAFVGQLLNISAATALVSYSLYTIEAANLPANNAMLLTIPLVAFGLFRFLYLVHTNADAEYPELLIARDLPMVISIVVWLATAGIILVIDGLA
ncbi:MAG: decaprenyl-phosphate phosphoribosyltransferase [Chloroflexi bacterium]|nr:decaprenyl-phosphate phosphoribosyltransferase [Chloroflexota bacterium]